MDVADLADLVGVDSYRLACEWAHRTATREHAESRPREAADPHELSRIVWEDWNAGSLHERLVLAFALYRDMPCYANLMYIKFQFDRFGPAERRLFWTEYRALLSDPDDALAAPVAYSLGVDYFEDGSVTEEAWRETTSIFHSLLDSAESVGGDIDRKHAQRFFARLRLPPATVGVDTLKRSLTDGWALVRDDWKVPRRRRRGAR